MLAALYWPPLQAVLSTEALGPVDLALVSAASLIGAGTVVRTHHRSRRARWVMPDGLVVSKPPRAVPGGIAGSSATILGRMFRR